MCMKKKISLFLLCFLVASCAGQEETSPTATEEDTSSPSAVEEETKENSQVDEEVTTIMTKKDVMTMMKKVTPIMMKKVTKIMMKKTLQLQFLKENLRPLLFIAKAKN